MFTIDQRSRMTWFQPVSLEPRFRFQMVGILFSLAIYNGITLPVNFPIAFYRRVLDLPVVNTTHIRDGWPELAKAFDELLQWRDGDVGDVFMRTYAFSFDALGERVDVDMKAFSSNDQWLDLQARDLYGNGPVSPSGRASPKNPLVSPADSSTGQGAPRPSGRGGYDTGLVTNANRSEYVADYISWLTDKSVHAQFEAFLQGFFTCLDRKSLQLFNAESLQALVEGHQEVDLAKLKTVVTYEEPYSAAHPAVCAFWSIVEGYTMAEKKLLLEFVTASDRVPANGETSVQFGIVRSTGDTELLPTSSTCFGKLMLPEYSSREKMAGKLAVALRNSKGFGAL